VDLAEGCRGQRRWIDERERALELDTQLGFREGSDGRERHRRNLVLQTRELLRDLRRQHIKPRRHELPHLDHEPAKVDREHVEALRDPSQAGRPGPCCNRREPYPREKQLVPPRLHQIASREPQDPAGAGAHGPDVGDQIPVT
jgi:hypothetical protein